MLKSKSKILVIFSLIIIVFAFYFTNTFANTNENSGWKVRITSNGTKDLLEGTKEITFEVKDNPNVVKGKIAPGTTAESQIDVDLAGTEWPVEISASIDDGNLKYDNFDLIIKIDGKEVTSNEVIIIEPENNKVFTELDGKKIITFELKWNESINDNEIGILGETIDLPINVKVEQHV